MENIYQGLITAIITPFKNNQLDLLALEKIIAKQIDAKVNGLVVAGSTGEGNNLSDLEYQELLAKTVAIAAGKIKVIAGCCSASTTGAVKLACFAEKAKVDGIMVTAPPYVKPTQEGIFAHIRAVAEATSLPIMIYATLSRTGSNISDETIANLSKLPGIIALKYSGEDLEKILNLKNILNENFSLITGDDSLALGFNAQGGKGCVSVAANIAPELCQQMQSEWANGNFKKALAIHLSLLPLYQALFNESNPIPVKYAACILGLCENELRLPLLRASAGTMAKINLALQKLNLS